MAINCFHSSEGVCCGLFIMVDIVLTVLMIYKLCEVVINGIEDLHCCWLDDGNTVHHGRVW